MNIKHEEYMQAQITLIGLLRKENVELRRKCEYMEIVENENAKLKELIMKDDKTGGQIAFLTPWEVEQRKKADMIRPIIKADIENDEFDPSKYQAIKTLDRLAMFRGESWADEAAKKLEAALKGKLDI